MNSIDFEFRYDELKQAFVVTKYLGHEKVIYIPNELAGKPVISISESFKPKENTKILILGKNIRSVSTKIFQDIYDLVVYSYHDIHELNESFVNYRNDLMGFYEDDDVLFALFSDKTAVAIDNYFTESRQMGYGKYGRLILISNLIMDEFNVVGIENSCFKDAFNLKKILLPDSIRWIGKEAFKGCTMLEDILITSETIEINDLAFSDCQHLGLVEIMSNIKLMGNSVFKDSSRITLLLSCDSDEGFHPNWNCDNKTVYYGYLDLKSDYKLTYALFKDFTAIIMRYSNNDFDELEVHPFIFHENEGYKVIGIAPYAFHQAITLLSVHLPYTLQKIHQMAFAFSHIRKIHIPYSVDHIGEGAFYGCIYLEKIKLPNQIVDIPKNLATNCISLQTVILGDKIKTLGESCFQDCCKLSQLILPNTLEIVETMSLYGTNIPTIILGSNVRSIGDLAFQHNHKLSTVVISNPNCTLGEYLFDKLPVIKVYIIGPEDTAVQFKLAESNYENIKVYAETTSVITIDGVIYLMNDYDTAFVVGYDDSLLKKDTNILTYIEDHKVTNIEANAFYQSKSLETLYVPDTVVKLKNDFISRCVNLKSVSIPSHFEAISTNWNTGTDTTIIENRITKPRIKNHN